MLPSFITSVERRCRARSSIGWIKETQEVLEYSAKNNILPEIELIEIKDINKAWDNLANKQMAKRYVIDMRKSFTDK